ncbi:hypothetical protein GDO81_008889 [Engystomops pustulosus]|uniref:Complement C3 n=1 Tax=Engystomops pustulosus TaxID=76066 RepID=A0AAV7BNE6_ENGPU|nr:hypothetical protein GDO81_008889 [Engystomops pustulosus]
MSTPGKIVTYLEYDHFFMAVLTINLTLICFRPYTVDFNGTLGQLSLNAMRITDGKGEVKLLRNHLIKPFNDPEMLLQYKIHVSVTVITDSGSDFVEAELNDIYIVKSPYKILFTRTSRYFKPGMPFDLMVMVTNPDGSPAKNIPVVVENQDKVNGKTQDDGISRLKLNTALKDKSMKITVKTAVPQLHNNLQASGEITVTAYTPMSGQDNYLHIGIENNVQEPRKQLFINFNIFNSDAKVQSQITHFTYLILNKGRIMRAGKMKRTNQALVTMQLYITEDFMPSFRIVAYYFVDKEIVSDSLWVDMVDRCMGTLLLKGERDSGRPQDQIKLTLQADVNATVGLVAVDKGVFALNSKYKLTQSKIWDIVEKFDIGCSPGSGADNMGVFYDAGLAVNTNYGMRTAERSVQSCKDTKTRRRRTSAALMEIKAQKASSYRDLEKQCCNDGMLSNPMGHKCDRRARLIQEGEMCVKAFLECCRYIDQKLKMEKLLMGTSDLERSDTESEYIPDAEILVRSDFPESWYWNIVKMEDKPNTVIDGISTKVLQNFYLKDTITTWELLAVSISENKGVCVAEPYDIQAFQSFFIDLKLPYSAVRNEQVEIRAILYNYESKPMKVRVTLSHNPLICSLSTAKKAYSVVVDVKNASSIAVPFVIVPLTIGQHFIEVKAAVYGIFAGDGVKKPLKVVYLEDSIDGAALNHLIFTPSGCAEQNMRRMTPVVIATHYLDQTNQWDRIGVNRREEAITNINIGFVNQQKYRRSDGSFPLFPDEPIPGTWLTAYIVKVFAMAKNLIDIGDDILCGSVKWLILSKQKPDGMFTEEWPISHQYVKGGVAGSYDPDVAMTAFVVISLLESQKYCTKYVNEFAIKYNESLKLIADNYNQLTSPHSVAKHHDALAWPADLNDPKKLNNISWLDLEGSKMVSIEATSYALLALLKLEASHAVMEPVVRWLIRQQFYGDKYVSTQATMMLFQALAQFDVAKGTDNHTEMDVIFTLPGRTLSTTQRIDVQSGLQARSEQTNINKDFVVTAKGIGQASLKVMAVYYELATEKGEECKNYDLSVTVTKEPIVTSDTLETISIKICFRHLKSVDATMSIIDVSMMTGFSPDEKDLKRLKDGVDKYISEFEINKGAFDKGTLIIYLKKVSHEEEECLKFRLNKHLEVGLVQPGSVTIYDYYAPESRCQKFYHYIEDNTYFGRICHENVCRCAEGKCLMDQEKKDAESRLADACSSGMDHVYKVTLLQSYYEKDFDKYEMLVTDVYKKGTDEDAKGNKRIFLSHVRCRKNIKLEIGKDYIVFGSSKNVWYTETFGYSYVLSSDSWIEWWPNQRECQDPEYEDLCNDFSSFTFELNISGCQS